MPHRAAVRRGALAGFAIHTLSLLWLWFQWDTALRRTLLVWLDIPVSLLYLGLGAKILLTAALVLGGLQWAAIGAGLALLVGRASRRAG